MKNLIILVVLILLSPFVYNWWKESSLEHEKQKVQVRHLEELKTKPRMSMTVMTTSWSKDIYRALDARNERVHWVNVTQRPGLFLQVRVNKSMIYDVPPDGPPLVLEDGPVSSFEIRVDPKHHGPDVYGTVDFWKD